MKYKICILDCDNISTEYKFCLPKHNTNTLYRVIISEDSTLYNIFFFQIKKKITNFNF